MLQLNFVGLRDPRFPDYKEKKENQSAFIVYAYMYVFTIIICSISNPDAQPYPTLFREKYLKPQIKCEKERRMKQLPLNLLLFYKHHSKLSSSKRQDSGLH